jgi:hypothetical protein
MGTEIQLFEPAYLPLLYFSLWGWIKDELYKRKLDTADELLTSILGCCWLHKETGRSTETNNTRSSHTSCKFF